MTVDIYIPQDESEITPAFCLQSIQNIKAARISRNLTFPRFVAALQRHGASITVDEYKKIEQFPVQSIPYIHDGLLTYADRVFNSNRTPGSLQSLTTTHAMIVIANKRRELGYSYQNMANMLNESYELGLNANHYRTCEQGITVQVPFDLVVRAANVLEIPLEDLL